VPARDGGERSFSDSECIVWLPSALAFRFRAIREPGETFSDVIMRLVERGSYAAITR
jgi:hypothetical protein